MSRGQRQGRGVTQPKVTKSGRVELGYLVTKAPQVTWHHIARGGGFSVTIDREEGLPAFFL